jgi:hypothetical protein
VKIYKTALRPVVTFVNENGQWRKLYNHEIKQIDRTLPITEYLRVQRLLWIGHVQRMNESERVPKKCLLLGQLDGTRLRGRSKARYMKLIEMDLKNTKSPTGRRKR